MILRKLDVNFYVELDENTFPNGIYGHLRINFRSFTLKLPHCI